jgi:hypothetical protein
MSKIIVCFLGTGAQSSGLVQKCLDDPEFTPRIVTRDPSSDKVKALIEKVRTYEKQMEVCFLKDSVHFLTKFLTSQGAQAVAADLMQDIPAEVYATKEGETIYGVFAVTDFWNSCGMNAEKEIAQGKRIADSIPASVEHVVFSTLADTRQTLGPLGVKPIEGDFIVPHLDSKSVIDGFFPADKTTLLETAFYYQNLDNFGMCSNGVLTLPVKTTLAAIDADDIGKSAYSIFKDPSLKGKRIQIAGEKITGDEYCKIMSEVTGKEFKYNCPEYEVYKSFGFPGAGELGNMFWYWDVSGNCGDPAATKESVCPELRSFREYCEQNKERIAKMAAN